MTTIESHVDEYGNVMLYFPGKLRLHIAPRAIDTGTTSTISTSTPDQRLLPAAADPFLNRPQAQAQTQGGPPMPADWHLNHLPRQVPNAGKGPSNMPSAFLTRVPSLDSLPSAGGRVFNLENDIDPGNDYRGNRDEWRYNTSVGEFALHSRDENAEACLIS